jgi:hypothetical protein
LAGLSLRGFSAIISPFTKKRRCQAHRVFASDLFSTAIEVGRQQRGESFVRAILIDPIRRTVQPHLIDGGLESLQSAVGGTIAWGTQLKTGDVLYVDDEGLLKPDPSFFALGRRIFAGCGLLVGPEKPLITDVVSTVDQVAKLVSFGVSVDLDQLLTVKSTRFSSAKEFFDYLRRQRAMDCE